MFSSRILSCISCNTYSPPPKRPPDAPRKRSPSRRPRRNTWHPFRCTQLLDDAHALPEISYPMVLSPRIPAKTYHRHRSASLASGGPLMRRFDEGGYGVWDGAAWDSDGASLNVFRVTGRSECDDIVPFRRSGSWRSLLGRKRRQTDLNDAHEHEHNTSSTTMSFHPASHPRTSDDTNVDRSFTTLRSDIIQERPRKLRKVLVVEGDWDLVRRCEVDDEEETPGGRTRRSLMFRSASRSGRDSAVVHADQRTPKASTIPPTPLPTLAPLRHGPYLRLPEEVERHEPLAIPPSLRRMHGLLSSPTRLDDLGG
jgi:hypothetical protein